MATAATAFVVIAATIATTITATVASATAAFATHHFHQFLNFFVSSRTAFNHFAFKDEIGACQRMVEVNDYYIRFDFYYAGIYASPINTHTVRSGAPKVAPIAADAIREMLATDGPFLLEACVVEEGNVLPMTPPGGSVNQMLLEC